jgi:glyoxylase-like metal-dependent hydrolase (beta-lactamase superfamily II)
MVSRDRNGAGGWFVTKRIGDGVFLIGEPPHVNSFLITGSQRAVLYDTGLGVASIRRVAEQLTDSEMLVVNSHSHWDHRGGNAEFETVACHEAGQQAIRDPVPPEELAAYAAGVSELLARFAVYREIDRTYFRLVEDAYAPRPLPPEFEPAKWRIRPAPASTPLREGDELNLGDRVLRVLFTPGHTADSICLLDPGAGRLFAGDTLATGPHTAALPGGDADAFAASLERLATEYAAQTVTVHPAHMVRYEAPGSLIRAVATAFRRVREDPPPFTAAGGMDGIPAREYWFDGFSVIVPATWAGYTTEPAEP